MNLTQSISESHTPKQKMKNKIHTGKYELHARLSRVIDNFQHWYTFFDSLRVQITSSASNQNQKLCEKPLNEMRHKKSMHITE